MVFAHAEQRNYAGREVCSALSFDTSDALRAVMQTTAEASMYAGFQSWCSLLGTKKPYSMHYTTIWCGCEENVSGKRILCCLDTYAVIFSRLLSCVFACCKNKDAILLLNRQPCVHDHCRKYAHPLGM